MARKAHYARLALKSAQAPEASSRRETAPVAEQAPPEAPVELVEVPATKATSEGAPPLAGRNCRAVVGNGAVARPTGGGRT